MPCEIDRDSKTAVCGVCYVFSQFFTFFRQLCLLSVCYFQNIKPIFFTTYPTCHANVTIKRRRKFHYLLLTPSKLPNLPNFDHIDIIVKDIVQCTLTNHLFLASMTSNKTQRQNRSIKLLLLF